VAIVQISQITNRKGLAENLPQLAGAELGWSTDTRQLWIGNGTLQDGAPAIGNTEILTEFSDVFAGRTEFSFGNYVVNAGTTATISNDVSAQTVFTIDTTPNGILTIPSFEVRYMIRRGVYTKIGTYIVVASTDGTGGDLYADDGPVPGQNGSTGVTFDVTETDGIITFGYTSTDTGITGTLYYSINYFVV
jgi:hypothetical protein